MLNIKIRIWAKNVQIKNNYLVIFKKFSKHETIFNIEATLFINLMIQSFSFMFIQVHAFLIQVLLLIQLLKISINLLPEKLL